MITDIEATADLIMSARHSDAFDREACVKILKDNLSGGGEAFNKGQNALVAGSCSPDEAGSSSPAQSSQPKPESWQEIAREAAKEIHWHHVKAPDAYGQEEAARTTKIILAAIERSHAAQASGKATPGYRLKGRYICENDGGVIFECNSKVDAEVALATVNELENANDHLFKISRKHCVENQQLKSELTAERQRREQAEQSLHNESKSLRNQLDDNTKLHDQLLSALAAIEKKDAKLKELLQHHLGCDPCHIIETIELRPDLSVLHQHDANLRSQWEKEHEQSK